MKNKFLAILLCTILSLNSFTFADAATSGTIPLTPDFNEEAHLESHIDNTIYEWPSTSLFYDYTSSISIGFSITGNSSNSYLSVSGYSEVNKISAYIYIQRYSSGKWSTISGGAFRKEANSSMLTFGTTKSLDTKGSYRLSIQIFVYTKDGNVELIEDVSNTEVY